MKPKCNQFHERVPRSILVYRHLLRFLPSEFRGRFAAEMEDDLRLKASKVREEGATRRLGFWLRVTGDLVRTMLREYVDSFGRGLKVSVNDLRSAIQSLRRSRGFVAGAVLITALGIGITSAVFSVAYHVLFKPLPYPDSDRLVMVANQIAIRDQFFFTLEMDWQNLQGIRESVPALETVAGYSLDAGVLFSDGQPEVVQICTLEPALFDILGVEALRGRLFDSEDARLNDQVGLISHELWRTRLGSDPGVTGTMIRLGDEDIRVIGIIQEGFDFPAGTPDIYRPVHEGERIFLSVLGRIRDGIPNDTAREQLASYFENRDGGRADNSGKGFTGEFPLVSPISFQVRDVRLALLALLGAVGLVLLIACANTANLILVRALKRRREIITRVALGAGRSRLIRMFAGESVLISLVGGLGGIILSSWLVDLIARIQPVGIPRIEEATVDLPVFVFALGISILSGLTAGMAAPLALSMRRLSPILRESHSSGAKGSGRLRTTLVVAEVALAVLLLVGSGLMIRSFRNLYHVELGFESENILTWSVELQGSRYDTPAVRQALLEQLGAGLNDEPAVEAVAFSTFLPVGLTRSGSWIDFPEGEKPPGFTGDQTIPGFGASPGKYTVNRIEISLDYFEVFGLELVAGRMPRAASETAAVTEIVISEIMAEELWGGTAALGHKLNLSDRSVMVVGIVRDLRYGDLRLNYLPTTYAVYDPAPSNRSIYVSVRTRTSPVSFVGRAREIIQSNDPELLMQNTSTIDEQVAFWLAEPRFYSFLFGLFATVALLLAVAGIYSVLSFSVSHRFREIGIRMALGADRRRTLRLIAGEGLCQAFTGFCLGLIAALAVTPFMRDLLFEIEPWNPITFIAAGSTLLLSAAAATILPAARACRVNPMEVLRVE